MTEGRRAAVFLDRDGVLIETHVRDGRPFPVPSAAEMAVLPGVVDACQTLRDAGFALLVVTNQPDIARGTTDATVVDAVNDRLRAEVPVDDVLVCPHDDVDACECRKPAAGLLVQAADRWDVDVARSFMVGDRWRDVEAGRRAGCRTVFIDRGYDEQQPTDPDVTVPDLPTAVPWILDHHLDGANR